MQKIKIRMKIEASLVILFMIIISISAVLSIPQKYGTDSAGNEWYGFTLVGQYPSVDDFIIGYNSTYYYAINGSSGKIAYSSLLASYAHSVINNCITEIYNRGVNKGGVIRLKSGTYDLGRTVNLTPGIRIEGTTGIKGITEPGTSVHGLYIADKYFFSFDDSLYGWDDSVEIKNIKFGKYGGTPTSYIYFKMGLYSRIEGCVMGLGSIQTPICLNGSIATWIQNCRIRGGTVSGISLNTIRVGDGSGPTFRPSSDVVIRDCFIDGNRDGVYIDEAATEVLVQGCAIVGNSRYDINAGFDSDAYGLGAQSCTIRECYFGESLDTAPGKDNESIMLCESSFNLIEGCYFNENSHFINMTWLFPNGRTYLRNNIIRNCWMMAGSSRTSSNPIYPLNISGDGTIVEGCTVPGINVSKGNNVTIRDCNISNAWGYDPRVDVGIVFTDSCNNALVENCRVINVNSTGINCSGKGSVIRNCYVSDVCNARNTWAVYANILEDNYINGIGCTYSVVLKDNGGGEKIIGNKITNGGGITYSSILTYGKGVIISNNFIQGDLPGGLSLTLTVCGESSIVNNNVFDGSYISLDSDISTNRNANYSSITNNMFYGGAMYRSIQVQRASNITIVGNHINGSIGKDGGIQIVTYGARMGNILISNNIIHNLQKGESKGIWLDTSATGIITNVSICNNYIYACNWPMNITAACYNITIINNKFSKNINSPIILTISNKTFGNDGWEQGSNWLVLPIHEPTVPVNGCVWLNLSTGDIGSWYNSRWNWVEN